MSAWNLSYHSMWLVWIARSRWNGWRSRAKMMTMTLDISYSSMELTVNDVAILAIPLIKTLLRNVSPYGMRTLNEKNVYETQTQTLSKLIRNLVNLNRILITSTRFLVCLRHLINLSKLFFLYALTIYSFIGLKKNILYTSLFLLNKYPFRTD